MADATVEGIEVEELVADGNDGHGEDVVRGEALVVGAGWPCQQRRKGASTELPAPQRFLDLPIWMSAPARRQETPEEETV